ncbi:hypothetical protein D3C78_1493760 [compost metagenome]
MLASLASNGVMVGVVAAEFRLRVEVIEVLALGNWLVVSTRRSPITPLTMVPVPLTP